MKKNKIPTLKEIESRIDEYVPASPESRAIAFELIAQAKAKKDGVINTRVSLSDLDRLKAMADEKGLGYQTLLGSVIHQYVTGQLIEIEPAKIALQAMLSKSR